MIGLNGDGDFVYTGGKNGEDEAVENRFSHENEADGARFSQGETELSPRHEISRVEFEFRTKSMTQVVLALPVSTAKFPDLESLFEKYTKCPGTSVTRVDSEVLAGMLEQMQKALCQKNNFAERTLGIKAKQVLASPRIFAHRCRRRQNSVRTPRRRRSSRYF